jgi:hypothetical protein
MTFGVRWGVIKLAPLSMLSPSSLLFYPPGTTLIATSFDSLSTPSNPLSDSALCVIIKVRLKEAAWDADYTIPSKSHRVRRQTRQSRNNSDRHLARRFLVGFTTIHVKM